MKVLMFGWELPPIYAGGIGMVCYDLLKELSAQGIDVTYLMPFGPEDFDSDTRAKIVVAQHADSEFANTTIDIKKVETLFAAYDSPVEYEKKHSELLKLKKKTRGMPPKSALYGPTLFHEVDLFAKRSYNIVGDLDFDVIHAHDWMTFPAAIGAADKSGKPLVVHVHNTIFDRYLGQASKTETDIERMGLERADKIVTVSSYIKDTVVKNYGIDPQKVEVIHNMPNSLLRGTQKDDDYTIDVGDDQVVLFTGRITKQKGPHHFVHCAKRVLEHRPKTRFIMAGSGDMFESTVQLTHDLGIADKFLFTGFYTMKQAKALYAKADCFVMPSVSEPFGIVPLEAMDEGAPTLITKSSGCSEIVSHALKSDYWDIDLMASKVIAVLQYPQLKTMLGTNGQNQILNMNWTKPATQCLDLYRRLQK